MTTTIGADGPLYVGPYVFASFDGFVTVLHVLVVVVFVLSLVFACAAMVVVAFSTSRGDSCGPPRAALALPPLLVVVSFVTGASLAAWAAGPGLGVLTLGAVSGLVVAAGWYIAARERRTTAAFLAVASRDGAGERS